MIYLVTRHPGALQWLRDQVDEPAIHLTHLDNPEFINAGDCVFGSLPVNKIAQLNRLGIRYLHLNIELPENLRGQELSSEQLRSMQACLREFVVIEVASDEALLLQAQNHEAGI